MSRTPYPRSSVGVSNGVRPASTMFATSATPSRAVAMVASSSTDSGASMNTASTPRSAAAFARWMASSRPTGARASVRAVTWRWVRVVSAARSWPATRRAAPPPCRRGGRTAWARPGPRGTTRRRRPTPTARRFGPRSPGCHSRRRCRPPRRLRGPRRTRRAASATSAWVQPDVGDAEMRSGQGVPR